MLKITLLCCWENKYTKFKDIKLQIQALKVWTRKTTKKRCKFWLFFYESVKKIWWNSCYAGFFLFEALQVQLLHQCRFYLKIFRTIYSVKNHWRFVNSQNTMDSVKMKELLVDERTADKMQHFECGFSNFLLFCGITILSDLFRLILTIPEDLHHFQHLKNFGRLTFKLRHYRKTYYNA